MDLQPIQAFHQSTQSTEYWEKAYEVEALGSVKTRCSKLLASQCHNRMNSF